MNKEKIIKSLNQILEMELAGVVRYTHYALMVCGYSRIPIIGWLRGQATESLDHELASLNCYKDLLKLVEGDSVMLEEYARTMIHTEEMHLGEVDKMLRNPGDVEPFNK